MKIFIIGDDGPEHNHIHSIHKTHEGALKVWNKLRLELLTEAKRMLKWDKEEARKTLKRGTWFDGKKLSKDNIKYFRDKTKNGDEMYIRMIKQLSCKDPRKIDNYPHDTPYIHEHEIVE